ncbi:putative bifunctional diguanylate cyclase/phosphodiesterase [Echinimonas agarilytica]|uniref:EAL domain-containing protein n=1 Tax=Echinimonas agarilytica TaxID=1215918 RepID=A0AA42B8R5_9GAMM|nr:EAL domain-containing protein [Echinimonas agarilytica]MCM2680486.1 EAL domain-containing protein [Echinimonas agarilytica]
MTLAPVHNRFKRLKLAVKARVYRFLVSNSEHPNRFKVLFATAFIVPLTLLILDGYQVHQRLKTTSQTMLSERLPLLHHLNDAKAQLTLHHHELLAWYGGPKLSGGSRLKSIQNSLDEIIESVDDPKFDKLWNDIKTDVQRLRYASMSDTSTRTKPVDLLESISLQNAQISTLTEQKIIQVINTVESQEAQTLELLVAAQLRSVYLAVAILFMLYLAFLALRRYWRASRYFRHRAFHDRVTGLPNQSKLLLDLGRRRKGKLLLAAIELSNLDIYSAGQGYNTVEQIHVAFSEHLQSILNVLKFHSFQIYRSGKGVYLLSGSVSDETDVDITTDLIQQKVSRSIKTQVGDYHPKWKRGATLIDPSTTPEQALDQLYTALAEAGYKGQDSLQFFSPQMKSKRHRRLAIQQALTHAIQSNELTMHYQPQIDLKEKRIVGAEALLRWHNVELGHVNPAEFIPVAEQCGLIQQIGHWVTYNAIQQASFWYHNDRPIVIAINISPRQFEHPEFVGELKQMLKNEALPPEYIELEITEGVLMKNAQSGLAVLNKLKELGVKLAIDDFGMGYSSLSYLHRFPIDKLKIDRSFITELNQSQTDQAIAKVIIELGKQLNLKIIAEGVETEEQSYWLVNNGCQYAQGYLYGKPMLSDDLEPDITVNPLTRLPH